MKFASTWMELENTIFSEVAHIQINEHYMFSLICSS